VARNEALHVIRVVGKDHSTPETDRGCDDQRVDGQFVSGTRSGEQVPGHACDARARGHDLCEAARQNRINRCVGAAAPVQLHKHCRWHAHGEVPLMSAAECSAHKLMTLQIFVWTCERGQRLAVKN